MRHSRTLSEHPHLLAMAPSREVLSIAIALSSLVAGVAALDNGLGLTPQVRRPPPDSNSTFARHGMLRQDVRVKLPQAHKSPLLDSMEQGLF